MARICINPGHGGPDLGACANGLKEKDLNLHIARGIANGLKDYQDIEVLLTRTGDETESLAQICKKCNDWKADFFLSIHNNAGGGTGFESYVVPNARQVTKDKQTVIHDEVMSYYKQYNIRDRGKKTANFYVLKNTDPGAVLLECLFVDHACDAALLKQVNFLDGLADAIARGIAKALGLKAKPKPAPAPVPPAGPLPVVQKKIAVQVNGKPVEAIEAIGYLINGTTYLQALYVAGLFGASVEGHGDYIEIKK